VHLWNRSLYENLQYGSDGNDARFAANLAAADLTGLLQHLGQGLQTPLGEGGTLLSGGEGQRVRFGRALGREQALLVLLDEPFRGLGRAGRAQLLARARATWSGATLLLVTHDIAAAQDFDRVLVMEEGRLVEEGVPEALMANPDSRYASLLSLEASVRAGIWNDPSWRRLLLDRGALTESFSQSAPR